MHDASRSDDLGQWSFGMCSGCLPAMLYWVEKTCRSCLNTPNTISARGFLARKKGHKLMPEMLCDHISDTTANSMLLAKIHGYKSSKSNYKRHLVPRSYT